MELDIFSPQSADSATFLSFKACFTDVDVQLIGRPVSYIGHDIQQLAKPGYGDFPNRTVHAVEVHFYLATSVSMLSTTCNVADLPTPCRDYVQNMWEDPKGAHDAGLARSVEMHPRLGSLFIERLGGHDEHTCICMLSVLVCGYRITTNERMRRVW